MSDEEIKALIDKMKQTMIDIDNSNNLASELLFDAGLIDKNGNPAPPYA